MARLACVLVAALLAGCGAPEAPAPQRSAPTIPTEILAQQPLPTYDATLTEAGYALEPPSLRDEIGLVIPNGTVRVWITTHFQNGAASNFAIRLAGCGADLAAVPGDGRNLTTDCGGLQPGNETVSLSVGAGALYGRVVVQATVCTQGVGTCQRMS